MLTVPLYLQEANSVSNAATAAIQLLRLWDPVHCVCKDF
jgi:hypothetical protein